MLNLAYEIILFISLLVLSAYFSSSETALLSLNKIRIQAMRRQKVDTKRIEKLLSDIPSLLSTIVFGNMCVNIAFSSTATAVSVKSLGEQGVWVGILLSWVLILVCGEILPKVIAITYPGKIAYASSAVLYYLKNVLYPVNVVTKGVVSFLFPRAIKPREKRPFLTEEELQTAITIGAKEGVVKEKEKEMIHYLLRFSDTEASQIMTPRVHIKAFDVKGTDDEFMEFVRTAKHARIPIYKESIDNIVGIIYTKDVFFCPEKSYRDLIREPLFVPESKRIDDLLKELRRHNTKSAIVIDQYGGTSGLVTLEDIQEDVFGDLYDEFEVPAERITKVGTGHFRVMADVSLKDINYELGLALPEEYDSLSGFLLEIAETIPKTGDVIDYKDARFVIKKATQKHIVVVLVEKKQ